MPVIHLSEKEFSEKVVNIETISSQWKYKGDKPALIDFFATWCGPCKKIGPDIEALAEEYKEQAVIGKCDVEENDGLAMRFGVRNVPTVIFIKNGEVVDKQVGAAPKSTFEEKLKAIL